MKRFSIISIIMLTLCTSAWGCGYEGNQNNHYMFSVFRREMMNSDLFTNRTDQFWKEYTGGKADSYRWSKEEIMAIAQKKGNREMVDYLNSLNTYLDICDQLRETWDYPTKAELQKRRINLNGIVNKANAYKGSRLKAQWHLLRMRANMVLGNHATNITDWTQKASKLPASVYRDMMENIYAGALLRQGQRTKACDIYAKQGDMVSIKWAMRKMRNLGGIKTIYDENPDSPTMNFLVQDFVNNAQETLDSGADKEWMEETLDSRVVLKNEVDRFIAYAQDVVAAGKTKSPALWMAAIGELQHLYGQHDKAMESLNKAIGMNGTQRMKDNARAIRMVVSAKNGKYDSEYNKWLTGELEWLKKKINEEATELAGEDTQYFYNHYYDILLRLVYNNVVPRLNKLGQKELAASFVMMLDHGNPTEAPVIHKECIPEYSSDFFCTVDSMTTNELKSFIAFSNRQTSDPLEQFVKKYTKTDGNYLNDVLGTKFLANGQFKEALEYLGKVSLPFLQGQNIADYVAQRDYTKARWLGKQDLKFDAQGKGPAVTLNKKQAFCREMIQLLGQHAVANETVRPQLAYDLAVRYYQASYWGDCWWLTQYGQSVYDSARVDRPDFVAHAIDYLKESAKSSNPTLRMNSLYALAYIPVDPWCSIEEDWVNDRTIVTPLRKSRQFRALGDLNTFVKGTSTPLPDYVQKCDVLKQFRKYI